MYHYEKKKLTVLVKPYGYIMDRTWFVYITLANCNRGNGETHVQ